MEISKKVIAITAIAGWLSAGVFLRHAVKLTNELDEAKELLQAQGEVIEKANIICDNEEFEEIIDFNDM